MEPIISQPTPPMVGQPTPPTAGQPTPPTAGQLSPPTAGQPSPPAAGQTFLSKTWQRVVGSIVALILVGAVSYVGAAIFNAVSKVQEHDKELALSQKDIQTTQKDLQDFQGTFGSTRADVDLTKQAVAELRVEVQKMEKILEKIP